MMKYQFDMQSAVEKKSNSQSAFFNLILKNTPGSIIYIESLDTILKNNQNGWFVLSLWIHSKLHAEWPMLHALTVYSLIDMNKPKYPFLQIPREMTLRPNPLLNSIASPRMKHFLDSFLLFWIACTKPMTWIELYPVIIAFIICISVSVKYDIY